MLESPVYQEILEEGKALGVEQRRKEGLELGKEAQLREDALEVVEVVNRPHSLM